MTRAVKEWIGKTPDTPAPPRVRLRVFDRDKGVCQITGRKVRLFDKWDLDHKTAIINGGENRESNLRLVLRAAHRAKTKADVAEKAKVNAVRRAHVLPRPKSQFRRAVKPLPEPDAKVRRLIAANIAHQAKMKSRLQ
jgi:hypothetical protein